MPYIPQRHKDILNPHLEKIRNWVVKTSLADPEKKDMSFAFLEILGPAIIHSSIIKVTGTTELRYWMVPDIAGILMNVAWELNERTGFTEPTNDLKRGFEEFYRRLNNFDLGNTEELYALVQILTLAIKNIVSAEGDDETYKEMANYSLTILGPDILIDVYQKDFNCQWLQFLVMFWQKIAEIHYYNIITPYENTRRVKNGDCEVFARIKQTLEKNSSV